MDKKVFFSQNGVTVSKTHLTVLGQPVEIEHIFAISCKKLLPDYGLALLSLLVGILLIADEGELFAFGGCLILSGVIAGVAARPRYAIILTTDAGEVNALTSTDKPHVDRVIQAINISMGGNSQIEIHDECLDADSGFPPVTPPAMQ